MQARSKAISCSYSESLATACLHENRGTDVRSRMYGAPAARARVELASAYSLRLGCCGRLGRQPLGLATVWPCIFNSAAMRCRTNRCKRTSRPPETGTAAIGSVDLIALFLGTHMHTTIVTKSSTFRSVGAWRVSMAVCQAHSRPLALAATAHHLSNFHESPSANQPCAGAELCL